MRWIVGAALALGVGCGSESGRERGEPLSTLQGELAWDVQLPDGTSCAFSRSYVGEEDRSSPWLCPTCTTIWRAQVELEGLDCYERLTATEPSAWEWLGTDGVNWFRAAAPNLALSFHGSRAEVDHAWTLEHHLVLERADGDIHLTIDGSFAEGAGRGDPLHGWYVPDMPACGTPGANPPVYDGDWRLVVGDVVPDGWFYDRCAQPTRLHDFEGTWLVIDISASDCPPCQAAASAQEAFLAGLAAEGLDVEVVTLMAPTLGNVLAPTPVSLLEDWTAYFGLSSPVLADRGWGVYVAGEALGDDFGYPTTVIVAPDLTVVETSVGFGGWEAHAEVIRAAAGG